jgi:hypothetical protein
VIEIIRQDTEYSYFYYKGYGIGLPSNWIKDINIEKAREVKEHLLTKYGQPFSNKDFNEEAYKEEKEELEKSCLNSSILISAIRSAPLRFDESSNMYIVDNDRHFLITISRGKSQTYKIGEVHDISVRDSNIEHIMIDSPEREKEAEKFTMFVRHLNKIDSLVEENKTNDIL